jgi:KaiC/GvpD/RAD55 family RecA-like ATPase
VGDRVDARAEIGDRIRALPPAAAAAVRLNPREYADDYFAVLNATLKESSSDDGAHTIYVSVTNPASLVWSIAQALDVRADRLSFVDAISHTMMNFRDPLPNAIYIESPRMLETIMLRIEYLLRRHKATRTMLVVDSVNSLAIHNPKELLNEFFHILVNNLKSRQVLTLLLIVSEDPASELDQMLGQLVDETVDVVRARG